MYISPETRVERLFKMPMVTSDLKKLERLVLAYMKTAREEGYSLGKQEGLKEYNQLYDKISEVMGYDN